MDLLTVVGQSYKKDTNMSQYLTIVDMELRKEKLKREKCFLTFQITPMTYEVQFYRSIIDLSQFQKTSERVKG